MIAQQTTEKTRKRHLAVHDLGRMPYAAAYQQQREVHTKVLEGKAPLTLLLVEHNPVITMSRRRNARQHLLADDATLDRLEIDVQTTDRGGDITYHGPGQIVAYPIFRLNDLRMNVVQYMRFLEQIVINTVAEFDVEARRIEGCTGVWVDHPDGPTDLAKLAALGVRVKRNVTLHGLALNVTTNLTHYATIVPCGLHGKTVTSLEHILKDRMPSIQSTKNELINQFRRHVTEPLP